MRKSTSVRRALRDLGLESALDHGTRGNTSADSRRPQFWLGKREMRSREREVLSTGISPDQCREEARCGRPWQCQCGEFHLAQSAAIACRECMQGLGEHSGTFSYRDRVVVFHDWRDKSFGHRKGRASVMWKAGPRPVKMDDIRHMIIVPHDPEIAAKGIVRESWVPASVKARGTGHNPRK